MYLAADSSWSFCFLKHFFIILTQSSQTRIRERIGDFFTSNFPTTTDCYFLKFVYCIAYDSESCLEFFVSESEPKPRDPFSSRSNSDKIFISSKGTGQGMLHADLRRLRLPLRMLKHCKHSLEKQPPLKDSALTTQISPSHKNKSKPR